MVSDSKRGFHHRIHSPSHDKTIPANAMLFDFVKGDCLKCCLCVLILSLGFHLYCSYKPSSLVKLSQQEVAAV